MKKGQRCKNILNNNFERQHEDENTIIWQLPKLFCLRIVCACAKAVIARDVTKTKQIGKTHKRQKRGENRNK